ncbi:MAG: T9SS type A sorting domain-containing protein, partial [Bacteroidales bacterium]|nr:T9SS type A sorting domain-containing protein [Bacteroidales bacterium]
TAAGGGKTINVTSNVNWTVSESCNWITVSPSSGSNNGTFTVTASANTGTSRTCVITVSGAGVTPQTITVTQQGYVGIVTEDAESSLMVYPNPTSDYLNIKADFEILQLQIVDVLGKVVLELGDINTDFIDIPVSNLPDAMYVIRVLSNDGNTYYKKITKK